MPALRYPIWRGREVNTYEALLNVLVSIENKVDALAFLNAYEAVNPHARENIGWAVGDMDRENGRRVLELFECPHPVFGTTFPTAEEALRAGMEAAKQLMAAPKPKPPWFVGALDSN